MSLRSSVRVGILAEDRTDYETIAALVRRIAAKGGAGRGDLGLRGRYGGGCSNLRKKARVWTEELVDGGCDAIILVHDLDRNQLTGLLNDESSLRQALEKIPMATGVARLVCVPVQEIEAWFFACQQTMRAIGGAATRAHPSPHLIVDPKEKLIELSRGANRKPRFATNDNPRYAEGLSLDDCARACGSFRDLAAFVTALFGGDS